MPSIIDYAVPGPLTSLTGIDPPALQGVGAALYRRDDLRVPAALIR